MFIFGYVDPSVMTYTIQAIVGAAIALSVVVGITWRVVRKKINKILKIDDSAKKEMEDEIQVIEDSKNG